MIKVTCKALPYKILSTQIQLTSLDIFRIKDINDTIHINNNIPTKAHPSYQTDLVPLINLLPLRSSLKAILAPLLTQA